MFLFDWKRVVLISFVHLCSTRRCLNSQERAALLWEKNFLIQWTVLTRELWRGSSLRCSSTRYKIYLICAHYSSGKNNSTWTMWQHSTAGFLLIAYSSNIPSLEGIHGLCMPEMSRLIVLEAPVHHRLTPHSLSPTKPLYIERRVFMSKTRHVYHDSGTVQCWRPKHSEGSTN